MANIIPFEGGALPAYLKEIDPSLLNTDLTGHSGAGFPVISIKGKHFAIVKEGERFIIPNPKDPESPATAVEMVIIKANKGTSKIWYAKGYVEGSEGVKPDCFSNDGNMPDPSVEVPQHKTCAACPKNVWGSKVSEAGKKIKACTDSVRLAVSTPDQINEPYMLRVPAASIKNLGEYGRMLAKRGVGYNMVVTKIGMDQESATPLLTFKAVGFLPADGYAEVKLVAADDTVQNIMGSAAMDTPAAAAELASDTDTEAAETVAAEAIIKAAEKPKAAPPKVATKAKAVTEVEVAAAVIEAAEAKPAKSAAKVITAAELESINLDELDFD
jgi:hypothetical protein